MAFVQIIELQTKRYDEIDALMEDWLVQTEGRRTSHRSMTTRDRDRPDTYVEIVEFPSYEKAMENSKLPQTSAFAEQISKLCDSPPTFRNLDVIRTQEM